MRKYVRKMLKEQAQKQGAKTRKFISSRFETIQIKKYGANRRKVNKAKGTHPRRIWKSRIALFVE